MSRKQTRPGYIPPASRLFPPSKQLEEQHQPRRYDRAVGAAGAGGLTDRAAKVVHLAGPFDHQLQRPGPLAIVAHRPRRQLAKEGPAVVLQAAEAEAAAIGVLALGVGHLGDPTVGLVLGGSGNVVPIKEERGAEAFASVGGDGGRNARGHRIPAARRQAGSGDAGAAGARNVLRRLPEDAAPNHEPVPATHAWIERDLRFNARGLKLREIPTIHDGGLEQPGSELPVLAGGGTVSDLRVEVRIDVPVPDATQRRAAVLHAA